MGPEADRLDLTGPEAPQYTKAEELCLTSNLATLQRRVVHGEFSHRTLDREFTCDMHRAFFGGVREHAGRCRAPGTGTPVMVFGPNRSVHCSLVATELDTVFQKLVAPLHSLEENVEDPSYERSALHWAVWLHAQIVRVHPFEDGNGRVSRLLLDVFLVRSGLWAIPLQVPRNEYYEVMNLYYRTKNMAPLMDMYLRLFASRLN